MNTRAARTSETTADAARPSAPGLGASAPGLGTGRKVLRAAALAATVPYLALKSAWLAGSRIGIPDGSVLLEPGVFFTVANAVTLVMDATVIVIVLALTRPWGMRVPAWLLTVPVFIATGLLTPILTGFPGQLLVKALGMGAGEAVKAAQKPFLDPWVFSVVYSGFTIQGLTLAGLFVPYARERWGWRWQGVLGDRLPPSTGVVAGATAAAGAAVGAVSLYWAFGGTAGLNAERLALYSAETGVVSAAHAMCALLAGAGALLLARGGARRAWWPLALGWIGSSATLSWGMWMLTASLGSAFSPDEEPTSMIFLTYAGQIITGLLAFAVLVRFLGSRRRAAA
ncbi:hypothetical protein [Streptomyces sp. ISL-86]|uniref:hypothetical protein n=1 Tax=Streptomyces sp. ISL-86 TaxID=2819187 RepID=UPI0020357573|nr:hypothetical protein [Streptomyces sp. ISL-86]